MKKSREGGEQRSRIEASRNDQKIEETTEKREEQAFIAGRTGMLHYSLQVGAERSS
jgi:hypothetical protein